MNEIRKNNEQENILLTAKMKLPKIRYIIVISLTAFSLLLLLIGIILLINYRNYLDNIYKDGLWYYDSDLPPNGTGCLAFGAFFTIFNLVFLVVPLLIVRKYIEKCKVIISNKKIYGVKVTLFSTQTFSFRLDMINNVTSSNFLGIKRVIIYFEQGKTDKEATMVNNKVFSIPYVDNIDEVLLKLNELISSVKNDKDVAVDIEMKKIEIEEKKADALAGIIQQNSSKTQDSTNQSYIDELKQLKSLLDEDIISQEEFEAKKKELLGL